jgi:hypothetical protein
MLFDDDELIDVYFHMEEYKNEYGNQEEDKMLDEDLHDEEEPLAKAKGDSGN